MSVFNRLRYFFRRRWTASRNHRNKRRSCAPPGITRGDGALEGAYGRSEEPRFPQNSPLATQANLGLLTKGEMNEAAHAVDTFFNQRTRNQGCKRKYKTRRPPRVPVIGKKDKRKQPSLSCKGVLRYCSHKKVRMYSRKDLLC